jgi:hypothetical protein
MTPVVKLSLAESRIRTLAEGDVCPWSSIQISPVPGWYTAERVPSLLVPALAAQAGQTNTPTAAVMKTITRNMFISILRNHSSQVREWPAHDRRTVRQEAARVAISDHT